MQQMLLIVTVSPTPRIRVIAWPTSMVEIDGVGFHDTGAGDTNGFYDFLRQRDGHVVGVRYTPFLSHSQICDTVPEGPGLRRSPASTPSIELFWDRILEYEPALSADQFCDWNYVFQGHTGQYAVTFGFSHLPEAEVRDLLSAAERRIE